MNTPAVTDAMAEAGGEALLMCLPTLDSDAPAPSAQDAARAALEAALAASLVPAGEDGLVERLEAAFEWIRQPDWAESFNRDEMVAWLNQRPSHVIHDAIAALRSRAPVERPDGDWVLVPREPTADMLSMGDEAMVDTVGDENWIAHCRNAWRAMVTAAPIAPAEQVAIKPLEWGEDGAQTSFIRSYSVFLRADGMFEVVGGGAFLAGPYTTREAAKAAAQADYERRIRSALVPVEQVAVRWEYKSKATGQWYCLGQDGPSPASHRACGYEVRALAVIPEAGK